MKRLGPVGPIPWACLLAANAGVVALLGARGAWWAALLYVAALTLIGVSLAKSGGWPRGKRNGRRVGGFEISVRVHLLAWRFRPRLELVWGEAFATWLCFRVRATASYDDPAEVREASVGFQPVKWHQEGDVRVIEEAEILSVSYVGGDPPAGCDPPITPPGAWSERLEAPPREADQPPPLRLLQLALEEAPGSTRKLSRAEALRLANVVDSWQGEVASVLSSRLNGRFMPRYVPRPQGPAGEFKAFDKDGAVYAWFEPAPELESAWPRWLRPKSLRFR